MRHIANAVLQGIHDVFPPEDIDDDDTISLKKVLKKEGAWAVIKEILGFEFDGNPHKHTVWLTPDQRDALLRTLKQWIRGSRDTKNGIPFKDFYKTTLKLRHAFISIPAGHGLMSPCNSLLGKQPPFVYLNRNRPLLSAVKDSRHLLRLCQSNS